MILQRLWWIWFVCQKRATSASTSSLDWSICWSLKSSKKPLPSHKSRCHPWSRINWIPKWHHYWQFASSTISSRCRSMRVSYCSKINQFDEFTLLLTNKLTFMNELTVKVNQVNQKWNSFPNLLRLRLRLRPQLRPQLRKLLFFKHSYSIKSI